MKELKQERQKRKLMVNMKCFRLHSWTPSCLLLLVAPHDAFIFFFFSFTISISPLKSVAKAKAKANEPYRIDSWRGLSRTLEIRRACHAHRHLNFPPSRKCVAHWRMQRFAIRYNKFPSRGWHKPNLYLATWNLWNFPSRAHMNWRMWKVSLARSSLFASRLWS